MIWKAFTTLRMMDISTAILKPCLLRVIPNGPHLQSAGTGAEEVACSCLLSLPWFSKGHIYCSKDHCLQISQLIAHRGGSAYSPENTLAAFRNAVEGGSDWLEMDVQRTLDGVLVVINDETVDRTTDGTGRVTDFTFEQVRGLDAGDGEQVPAFK